MLRLHSEWEPKFLPSFQPRSSHWSQWSDVKVSNPTWLVVKLPALREWPPCWRRLSVDPLPWTAVDTIARKRRTSAASRSRRHDPQLSHVTQHSSKVTGTCWNAETSETQIRLTKWIGPRHFVVCSTCSNRSKDPPDTTMLSPYFKFGCVAGQNFETCVAQGAWFFRSFHGWGQHSRLLLGIEEGTTCKHRGQQIQQERGPLSYWGSTHFGLTTLQWHSDIYRVLSAAWSCRFVLEAAIPSPPSPYLASWGLRWSLFQPRITQSWPFTDLRLGQTWSNHTMFGWNKHFFANYLDVSTVSTSQDFDL